MGNRPKKKRVPNNNKKEEQEILYCKTHAKIMQLLVENFTCFLVRRRKREGNKFFSILITHLKMFLVMYINSAWG